MWHCFFPTCEDTPSVFSSVLLFPSTWLHLEVLRRPLGRWYAGQQVRTGQLRCNHLQFFKRENHIKAAEPSFQSERVQSPIPWAPRLQLLILSAGPGSPAWVTTPEPRVWILYRVHGDQTCTSKRGQRERVRSPLPGERRRNAYQGSYQAVVGYMDSQASPGWHLN